MNDEQYRMISTILAAMLTLSSVVLAVQLFSYRKMNRGYYTSMVSVGFFIIFARNVIGFNYFMTYLGQLFILAGFIGYINVARVLKKDDK